MTGTVTERQMFFFSTPSPHTRCRPSERFLPEKETAVVLQATLHLWSLSTRLDTVHRI